MHGSLDKLLSLNLTAYITHSDVFPFKSSFYLRATKMPLEEIKGFKHHNTQLSAAFQTDCPIILPKKFTSNCSQNLCKRHHLFVNYFSCVSISMLYLR